MMNKKLYFDMYAVEVYSQRFKRMFNEALIRELFDFMQEASQVTLMIEASQLQRPALEGVILQIEDKFPRSKGYDLSTNMRHRQITGSMVRFIMGQYGYLPGKPKAMKKGKYISSAIVYKVS